MAAGLVAAAPAAATSDSTFARILPLHSPHVQENTMEWLRPGAFFGSITFALIGVVVFWLSFVIIDKITPYDLWQELVEKRNMALAVVVAAMALGISIIVAASVHG
jgi:putative membrane protein